MGCIKLKTDFETIGLQEFVEKNIYNPYNEDPLQVEVVDENEMKLINPGKWSVTINSIDGSFVFEGKTDKYYEIDRILDIRYKFGPLFTVLRSELNKQKNKAYGNKNDN